MPGQIIALSPSGVITTLGSENFGTQVTWEPQTDGTNYALLKSFIYSRSDCSFLPPRTAPLTGAVVVLILVDSQNNDIGVTIVNIANEGGESTFIPIGSYHTGFEPKVGLQYKTE